MTQYDPKVIIEFAEQLYSQANSIIATHTAIGAIVGLVFGYIGGRALNAAGVGALILGAIAGAIGFSIGRQKAFSLKLQAQTALCRVRIEENTRKA